MKWVLVPLSLVFAFACLLPAQAGPAVVAAGELPGDILDATGKDSLGGLFSSFAVDRKSLKFAAGGISGRIFALPDRGFGDGAFAFRCRLQVIDFTMSAKDKTIQLTNSATLFFTSEADGKEVGLMGINPDDHASTNAPVAPAGPAQGWPCMDPEGLAMAPDGTFYVGEEYRPGVFQFDAKGKQLRTLPVPEHFVPHANGALFYAQESGDPEYGRRPNKGFECLGITPDGSRLVAMLQGSLAQDGDEAKSQSTRVVVWDLKKGAVAGEFVYPMPRKANDKGTKVVHVNEVLPINNDEFLVLERCSRGYGSLDDAEPWGEPSLYRMVVLADLRGATDLTGTKFTKLPSDPDFAPLPEKEKEYEEAGIKPIKRSELIDMLAGDGLASVGLNADGVNPKSLGEKMEGLGIIPLREPGQFLVLVGNDNDFKAGKIFHGGAEVATSPIVVPNRLIAYRISLPTCQWKLP